MTGTLQAHVDVTAAADDPHPNGEPDDCNGAFTVEPTGVTYTNLDGRIDLQPDRVHIDEIRVLDNHENAAVDHRRPRRPRARVGEVRDRVKADDFKVIDNKMGNVRVNSDLRVTGELNAPRIEGNLGVTTGAVNLDPILRAGRRVGVRDEADRVSQRARPHVAAARRLRPVHSMRCGCNVHLTVPNDLVVKASRPPDARVARSVSAR